MVLNAACILKTGHIMGGGRLKKAAVCLLFSPLFSLEWGGEQRVFCKILLLILTLRGYGFVSSWVVDTFSL